MLTNAVINFTKGNVERELFYAKSAEYMDHYAKGTVQPVMHEDMLRMFAKEVELISGMKMDAVPDMAMYTNFRQVQEAAFAVLSMVVQPLVVNAAMKSFGAIAEFKNGAFGDSFSFNISPRDLFVVTKGARSQRSYDIERQYKTTKTIVPEFNTITVGVSLYEILVGTQTLAEYISKAALSLNAALSYDIYDTFSTAMNALATSGDSALKVSGYTQDSAIELAQKIQAWTSTKPIFLGTSLALSKILPTNANYRMDLGSDYVKLGHLRDFNGFACVELEQIADYTTEFATKIADDEIYVIAPSGSDKFVKVCMEGSMLSDVGGNFDTANLMTTGNLRLAWGVGVITGGIGGMIKLA